MKIRKSFYVHAAAAVCPLILLLYVFSGVSCRITADGVQSVQGDMSTPELIQVSQLNEIQLCLVFSENVTVTSVSVYAEGELFCAGDSDGPSAECIVTLDAAPEMGRFYVLSGSAEDQNGNSLLFTIPFRGYNGRVPVLVLSEIRSEYTKDKSEFIELYAVSPGNLAGLVLYSANDDKYGSYEFPSAEVNAGEYITVHFRLSPEDPAGCIDETGSDLDISFSKESCRGARDFWVANSTARIGKSDVILLRERAGGRLIDAILYSESSKNTWKTDAMVSAAEEAVASGIWPSGSEFDEVFCSDGVTATRTISRRNISDIAAAAEQGLELPESNKNCWSVTATSGATPGAPNSGTVYNKQNAYIPL